MPSPFVRGGGRGGRRGGQKFVAGWSHVFHGNLTVESRPWCRESGEPQCGFQTLQQGCQASPPMHQRGCTSTVVGRVWKASWAGCKARGADANTWCRPGPLKGIVDGISTPIWCPDDSGGWSTSNAASNESVRYVDDETHGLQCGKISGPNSLVPRTR